MSATLTWNSGLVATWLASAANCTAARDEHEQKPQHRRAACRSDHLGGRRRRERAEEARVHNGDGACKQCERHDVADVGGGVGPYRLADCRRQPRLLKCGEDMGCIVRHHRISTVFPSTVMRSARISSLSTVEG